MTVPTLKPKRHVLLTGATGAIGSAVLDELVKDPDVCVYVLVRAISTDEARQRVVSVLRFLGLDFNDPLLWKDRLRVATGDLTQPLMGMKPDVYQQWTQDVSHVIHAAGNVKLNQSEEAAQKDAVESTQRVLEFIELCRQKGSFVKFDYFSSVGVCGRWTGLVPEQPMSRPRMFHNTYEAAKADAEDQVWAAMQAGLPATIHRPSMVVGDSKTGRIIYFQVFYHLIALITGIRTWGIVPASGKVRLDIIPADYVAKAVALSSKTPETIGRIFHLCSGPAHALTAFTMSHRLRDVLMKHGRKLPSLKIVSSKQLLRWLPWIRPLMPAKLQRAMKAAPFILSYLDTVQIFSNEQTDRFFSERGLNIPSPESYLPKLVEYYLMNKEGV